MLSWQRLDNYFDKSRLTLQDYDFIGDVESDVVHFADGRKPGKRVLVFPPVNNYRRFLIHKLVDEQFPELATFSIGEGDERRPVVCFKSDYIQPQIVKPKPVPDESLNRAERAPKTAAEEPPKRTRRSHAMPSISIYRPPAARRHDVQTANYGNQPDREPMGDSFNGTKHDCKCPTEGDDKRTPPSGISMFKSAITSIKTQQSGQPAVKCNKAKKDDIKATPTTTTTTSTPRQRRPDMKVYVPKARRGIDSQTKVSSEDNKDNGETKKEVVEVVTPVAVEETVADVCESSRECAKRTKDERVPVHQVSPTSLWIEAQNEVEEKPKQEDKPETMVLRKKAVTSTPASTTTTKRSSVQLNPDECDWESMFDDSGECLDPTLLEQLSTAVGAVTIEKPKSGYDTYKTKSLDMVSNEFPHVIEIYNFPPEFRLQDLMTVFSEFRNAGFEIKWVDDTHALGIFGSSQIVSEVLAYRHPFVKTRLLKDGTTLSKAKARRSAEQLLPYKPRPDTCPALARRLVTGALGMKLPTSREEREAERKILTQAREKKRLEAKQREEAWEGTFH